MLSDSYYRSIAGRHCPDMVEECCQEMRLELWQERPDLFEATSATGLIRTILIRKAINYHRKLHGRHDHKIKPILFSRIEAEVLRPNQTIEAILPPAPRDVYNEDDLSPVLVALNTLPERTRRLIQRNADGVTLKALALEEHLSPCRVGQIVQRAKEKMKVAMSA